MANVSGILVRAQELADALPAVKPHHHRRRLRSSRPLPLLPLDLHRASMSHILVHDWLCVPTSPVSAISARAHAFQASTLLDTQQVS